LAVDLEPKELESLGKFENRQHTEHVSNIQHSLYSRGMTKTISIEQTAADAE
jgi:hypothetical protein